MDARQRMTDAALTSFTPPTPSARRIRWRRKLDDKGVRLKHVELYCPVCNFRLTREFRLNPGSGAGVVCGYRPAPSKPRCGTQILVTDIAGYPDILIAEVSDEDMDYMADQGYEGAAQIVYLLRNPVRVCCPP